MQPGDRSAGDAPSGAQTAEAPGGPDPNRQAPAGEAVPPHAPLGPALSGQAPTGQVPSGKDGAGAYAGGPSTASWPSNRPSKGGFPLGMPRRAVAHPTRSYLATRVLTAPPQVLVLMLMDGVLREVARALQVDLKAPGGRERLHRALTRAQDFLRELMLALDHERGGELAARLSAIYLFCQERLIEANVKANPRLAADAVRVLVPIRDAWATLCSGGTGPAAVAGGGPDVAAGARGGAGGPGSSGTGGETRDAPGDGLGVRP